MNQHVFVIVGFNSSAYGLARVLHENYQIKPFVIGDVNETSPIRCSVIVERIAIPKFRDSKIFTSTLINLSQRLKKEKKTRILLCSSEMNLYFVLKHYQILIKHFIIPYPKPMGSKSWFDKEFTAKICQQANLPYPSSQFLSIDHNDAFNVNLLKFPLIVKPSNSATYRPLEFKGKQKIYTLDNLQQLENTLSTLRNAKYQDSIIVQDLISSEQYNEYSVNGYCDRHGAITALASARALVGWPNALRRGNHLAMISTTAQEQNRLYEMVHKFIQQTQYHGLFNLDFIEDSTTHQLYLLEFNPRQSRSHYYCEMSKVSLIQAIIDDYILNKEKTVTKTSLSPFVWLEIPLEYIEPLVHPVERSRFQTEVFSDVIDLTLTYSYDLEKSKEFNRYVEKKINNIVQLLK